MVAALLSFVGCGSDPDDSGDPSCAELSLVCPESETVALTAPGALASIPGIEATGGCGEVEITTSPALDQPGQFAVTATATDPEGNQKSCELSVDVVALYAPQNVRVISAHLEGTETHPIIAWDRAPESAAEMVAIEVAGEAAGPFSGVADLAVDAGTFALPSLSAGSLWYRVTSLGVDGLIGGSSDAVEVNAVRADAYNLSSQAVPGIDFSTSLYAVVRAPVRADAGPRPLVLFMHGNHQNCMDAGGFEFCQLTDSHECSGALPAPNAEGFLYLMDTLAAQGYVTASLSANAINCRPDGEPERAALFLEHIRRWVAWNSATPPPPFSDGRYRDQIDLQRVSVVGHSRGGEAAASVPQALAETPIAGVSVAGVVAVAPVDYYGPAPANSDFAVVLPACDGDVYTLEGKRQYDRILRSPVGKRRSQLFLPGANHNFFNTSWIEDDAFSNGSACTAASRLAPAAQRAVLEDYLGQWLAAAVGPARVASWISADAPLPASAQTWIGEPIAPRISYASADRTALDDFTSPLEVNDVGGFDSFTGLAGSIQCSTGCSRFEHALPAIRVAWTGPEGTARIRLGLNGRDLSAVAAVSMRVAARYSSAEPLNDGLEQLDLVVEIEDAAGQIASVPASAVTTIPAASMLYHPREILATVRIPIRELRLANPALDLTHIAALSIVGPAPSQPSAAFWLTNIELDNDVE